MLSPFPGPCRVWVYSFRLQRFYRRYFGRFRKLYSYQKGILQRRKEAIHWNFLRPSRPRLQRVCPLSSLRPLVSDSTRLECREHTVDYQGRRHEINFTLTPYYGSATLDYLTAAHTLQLNYRNTTLLYERLNKKTTGLDPLAVRTTPILPGDPPLPIASINDPRLSLDIEGTVVNDDGTCVFLSPAVASKT